MSKTLAYIMAAAMLISLCALHKEPLTIAPQVQRVRSAVVHIEKDGLYEGSGCLISPDGIMFSAKHLSDAEPGDYTITLDNGKQYKAKYVLEDRENDLCFIKLNTTDVNLPYATLIPTNDLQPGDFVFILGSPFGKDNFNSVSLGILSATKRDLYNRRGWESYREYDWHVMIQTTSPAFPGNSGGPVFDLDGRVVGVLVAGDADTLNYAVPVARFRETIDTVRQWFNLCRFNVVQPYE